ncbi:hypothetical protein DWB79_04110 [Treponema medium]|uniref:Lipopolysaccharide assembly protein A domain-containing protein n=2 Tax=Treponema medium TaxID=58231 RepID=A0AA87NSK2_TREMD|nr:hypothetical protein [Treponema medium]EPF29305.1 hypothetical protein HMPREF9195_00814 [Treponema medium ATCC 700293]QSH96955.1 hypothetical protein DWB79_04110 [Treponema medium]
MPGKLLYFILVILMLALFMGFNLSNHCDISVIFYVFKDVPIFLSMLFAFLFGNIAVLPFLISSRHKMKKAEKQAALYHDVEKVELKPEKRRWFGKKKHSEENGTAKQDV